MCSWKPGLAVTLNGPLTSLTLRLLSCKMGPRTCVHVTGGGRCKHVPVRALGRAWPEAAPHAWVYPCPNPLRAGNTCEGSKDQLQVPSGRGVSGVMTHRLGTTSKEA